MARTDAQTNVRLPEDLKEWLKSQAVAARRSVTAELIFRLEQSRKAQEATHAQAA
ncbi:Arc family DNA-binding protein [Delftia tsuruhatensis]|uniref:Arc domain-containing protein n=1 Tax=Delftia tsuruhatensis TaxID=180282 RepID=A0ABM6E4V7_9BURK|nr:Arc family DNA-binding protein [Delftia tsuruhatensis]AOV02375.1 Arc domain-containing protein [Delftia tsuruhatensis]